MDLMIIFNVVFAMVLGAIATLVWQWQLAPKEFKELMKAVRTFKKTPQ